MIPIRFPYIHYIIKHLHHEIFNHKQCTRDTTFYPGKPSCGRKPSKTSLIFRMKSFTTISWGTYLYKDSLQDHIPNKIEIPSQIWNPSKFFFFLLCAKTRDDDDTMRGALPSIYTSLSDSSYANVCFHYFMLAWLLQYK